MKAPRDCGTRAIADWLARLRRRPPGGLGEAVLFTRAGCTLCDEARRTLEHHGLVVREIDIDADPALRERYGECIPVVHIDGRERFRGRVDPILLRRLAVSMGRGAER